MLRPESDLQNNVAPIEGTNVLLVPQEAEERERERTEQEALDREVERVIDKNFERDIESFDSSSSTATISGNTGSEEDMKLCGKRNRSVTAESIVKRQRMQEELDSDVTCPLCQDLLVSPVCTMCGHTFCKACILRSLDRSSKCPLCRGILHLNGLSPVNLVMEKLLMSIYGDRYTERLEERRQEEAITDKVPLLVLQVPVFPGQKLPLNIFDARYKLMLRRVLDSGGIFGIVSLLDKHMSHVGTLVSIENHACIADGRHLLTVKGLSRFQLVESELIDGYNVATVQHLEDEDTDDMLVKAEDRSQAIVDLPMNDLASQKYSAQDLYFCTLDQLKKKMSPALPLLEKNNGSIPTSPSAFSFWLASVLPLPSTSKQSLLECKSTKNRLLEEFKILSTVYSAQ